jgi:phenylpyruvate tautomerase PptA (4-oxalocrotonate tautomerase family)
MPVTQITLLRGYAADIQTRLVARVSAAVRSVIPAPEAGTTTFVQEVSTYRRDGRVFEQGNVAQPEASAVVRAYLEAMEARDLATAQGMLAPGFVMTFPGGQRFTQLEQLVSWAKGRYQRVGKVYTGFEECWRGDDTVVYCCGTLHGVWPNGEPFEGIRFIDRFVVQGNQLLEQDVWNDLAEALRG